MACKRRKKEKRAQDLMRIRERRNHLNAAVNRSNDVRSELSPPSTETTSPTWNALPTLHVDKCLRFCRGVPKFCGTRSSVYRHAVKGILMTISSILAVQLKFFYGVSERRHALYWISLCDVFRMCFCYCYLLLLLLV